MFTANCTVRCVAYRRAERNFTIGKTYGVVNNTIRSDDGYIYGINGRMTTSIIDWLAPWYTFELVAENSVKICSLCGEVIPANSEYVYLADSGECVCNSCANERVVICDCCGQAVLDNNAEYINGEHLCNSCFHVNYRACDYCGEITYRYDLHRTSDYDNVCENCLNDYFRECGSCGSLVHEDNAIWDDYNEEYYCEDCYNAIRKRSIKPYHFKPTPHFYGGKFYERLMFMGVELEVDRAGEDHENAETLLNIANNDREHIYIKHDGSLCEGFEIVSHPATLEYHLTSMPWKDVMEEAREIGYRSHDTDTCGLHVHVSRDALGNTYDEQDATISKILYFVENNWDYIIRFTRRSERNLSRWASRYGIECDVKETYKKAKNDWNRYRCLNLCNDHTIEFRMFRGTLNYVTFCATLELVHNICAICMELEDTTIEQLSWNDFISRISAEKYPELFKYLEIRSLNV